MLRRLRDYLLPSKAEQDEEFRREIQRLSVQGLYAIAVVQLAAPVFMLAAQILLMAGPSALLPRTGQAAAVICVGLLTLVAARTSRVRPHARLAGIFSGGLVGSVLICSSLLMTAAGGRGDHYIPGQITLVMLVGMAALPLLPLHIFGLGLFLGGFYAIAGHFAVEWGVIDVVDPDRSQRVFVLMLTFVSTALTALIYSERVASHRAHQDALRVSETLCKAQSRMLLSENAASMGRLAAALSHELNNPIGALRSSVDTMLLLCARQSTSPPEDRQRLVILMSDVRRSILNSVQRLQEMVARLQRFTNLDKADIQPANLNELIGDVVALLEPEIKDGIQVDLDLRPLRPVLCRPQQLSAVFSGLVHNAIESISNGSGRIRISTSDADSEVEVRIDDSGRGMRREDLSMIFDPGFKVSGGRVSTGNWSLFSSRQIIREHGGDIRIESEEGKGTSVSVILPRLSKAQLERGGV